MCNEGTGKKVWLIPDCELPEAGEGILKGHESVIVVNDNDTVSVTECCSAYLTIR